MNSYGVGRVSAATLLSLYTALACGWGPIYAAEDSAQGITHYEGTGFKLSIPSGLTVGKEEPAHDFTIYAIQRGDQILMRIYEGNFPDFPKEKALSAEKAHEAINGLETETIAYARQTDTMSRESLIRLLSKDGWPQYLHLWYLDLSHEDAAEMDRIIGTVRSRQSIP